MSYLMLAMLVTLLITCFIPASYFVKHKQWRWACAMVILLPTAVFALYFTLGNGLDNIPWLQQQQRHQQLLEQFNQLGSVDEIIARIESRLQTHPEDKQGYYLLARLYQSQGEYQKAEQAYAMAAAE